MRFNFLYRIYTYTCHIVLYIDTGFLFMPFRGFYISQYPIALPTRIDIRVLFQCKRSNEPNRVASHLIIQLPICNNESHDCFLNKGRRLLLVNKTMPNRTSPSCNNSMLSLVNRLLYPANRLQTEGFTITTMYISCLFTY